MPASYTHHLIAARVFDALPSILQDVIAAAPSLYFFGAQGADFCFFYRFLQKKSKNFGSYLHRKGGYTAFCALKHLSARDTSLLAYTLGYITHYAADVTFHPFVYHLSGTSPLKHARIETAIDLHYKQSCHHGTYKDYFRKKLTTGEINELFFAYTVIAAKCDFQPLQKPAFLRAISLFNAYLPLSYTHSLRKNDSLFKQALNKEKRVWNYPLAPHLIRDDSAEELFEKSIAFALTLSNEWAASLQHNSLPNQDLFGKNYLTGL